MKGGMGGLEDIEKATNDLLQVFISSPCLSCPVCFILWLCLAISLFPTHSPANGYLPCWKGLRFLTGEIDNRTAARKKKNTKNTKNRQPQKKKEGERRSGHKWEKRTENISLVSVSPVTPTLPPTLPHSCNGSEGLATDSEGREKRITCQYLFPPAAWIETDTLHSLSRFPPKANSRALPLFGINRTSGSRLGESRHGKIVNEDTKERYEFRAKRVREWLTQINNDFYGHRMGIKGEWTFPIASLWKANNESKHCLGWILLSHRLQAASSVWAVIPLGATGCPFLGNCTG